MKRLHLFRVEQDAEAFSELFSEALAVGLRGGWLDFSTDVEPPSDLAGAAAAGALRAVRVQEGSSTSVKKRVGPPVLPDLLREHFSGCRWVLVRGASEAPRLAPTDAGAWALAMASGADAQPKVLNTAEFLAALRKARPFSKVMR